MKNKGFSLIEIVVAIAIIGILSGIVGLQLRGYMAKAKDAKVIASLNSFRVASQLYQAENEEPLIDENSIATYDETKVKEALQKLEIYLDSNAKAIINNPKDAIGGSRSAENGDIKYGGQIRFTFKNPNGNSDGYNLWIEPVDGTGDYDTKGKKWIEY